MVPIWYSIFVMKLNFINKLLGSATVATTSVVLAANNAFAAFNGGIEEGAEAARGQDHVVDLFGTAGVFATITNILLFLIGAIAVIMLIIGGFRYVLSGGNTASVTAAKNTILYAIIGIIVALLAYAAINFIISSLVGGGAGTGAGGEI